MRSAIVIGAAALVLAGCSGGRDATALPQPQGKVLAIVWNDEGGDLVELEAASLAR